MDGDQVHAKPSHVVEGASDSSSDANRTKPIDESAVEMAGDEATRNLGPMPYVTVTIVLTLLTVCLRAVATPFDLVNIGLIYLLPVLFSAVRWGLVPSFYAAGVGVLAFDFFFVPPFFSFTVADLRYLISFAIFLSVASLTASLASRLRRQLEEAKQSGEITSALYALSREITVVADADSALRRIVQHITLTMGAPTFIYLPRASGELVTAASSTDRTDESIRGDHAIATWVFRNGTIAGRGTQILRDVPGLYLPLRTADEVHGVMEINFESENRILPPELLRLAEALAGLSAMAIARIKLQEEARNAHLLAESEKLRTALLDSISHELRTPLATIIGATTSLVDGDSIFSPTDRSELLSTIRDGAMRMNRLVSNLLGMVRLESGMLRLRKQWCDLEEIIGVSLDQVQDLLASRTIQVELCEELPLIAVDDVLIEQVLVNVLSNAIKYSPAQSEITLSVRTRSERVDISVSDQGIGLNPGDAKRIFDKFYRSESGKHIPGTGLGLAICKGIVELHGGTIQAQANSLRGTTIIISLPAVKAPNFLQYESKEAQPNGEEDRTSNPNY